MTDEMGLSLLMWFTLGFGVLCLAGLLMVARFAIRIIGKLSRWSQEP